MNLSAPFIKRPVMTTLLMAAILLFGIIAYRALPVSDLPNIEYPTITVYAYQPGGSPQYMADTVATPLERSFASISGLQTLTSRNTIGETTIVLNFSLDVDLSSKEVEVQSAITKTLPDLPPMPSNPTFEKTNPAASPIMFLCLSSKTQPLSKLYEYGYEVIAQPISMIDGISQVQVYGYPYAVRVQADPMKLVNHKIDLNELSRALVKANPNLPSGVLQGEFQNVILETDGQISIAESYNKVIVKEVSGYPLRVENVATAIDALEDRYPYFRYISKERDENVVVLAVSRLPGSNTLNISSSIQKMLPKLERNIPDSINTYIFYDHATTILSSVKEVQFTLILSLILVVVVIYIYLGKFLDTLIPSLVLPLSILATFIVIYLAGFTIDILSLLAITLAIGFIIDDSIVVQENIVRHVELGFSAYEAALEGAKQISVTVLTMTLALSSVFIPMIWMPGILGRIFNEFSITIVVAILCSGFISLSLNPLLCSRFLKPRKKSNKTTFSRKINQKFVSLYERYLHHSILYRKTTVAVGIACFFLSLLFLYILPTDFIPPGNISLVQGLTQTAEGSSNRNAISHQMLVNEKIKENPFVEGFVTIAGYPSSDQGVIYARLTKPSKRPSSSTIAYGLSANASQIPGVNAYMKAVPLINLQVGNTMSIGEYQYTLSSMNSAELYAYAKLMVEKMRQMPELVGVNSDMRVKSPQLNVTIDRDRAGFYSITAEEIESTLQYAFSGGRISTFNAGSNLYDLILEVLPEFDLSSKDLDMLYVKSPTTQELVPMTSLATWKEVLAPSAINHINTFPAVTISFGLAPGVSLGTALKKIETLSNENLPENIIGDVQGSAQVFIETFESMKWLIIIAILVIYILLGILYENFIHPLTILTALPIAVFGGLLTLWIFGEPLSLYSVVGLIVLIGLVQKNGIMMIDFALEYLKTPGETPHQAILEACKVRFRPIIMTTFAAMMGALPIALGIGENGETNRPLGLVVVGGLIFSQLLTLFVTPVFFLYMEDLRLSIKEKFLNKN